MTTINDREWAFLSQETGLKMSFNDMYFRYLRSLGYAGTLQDMIAASGFGFTPSQGGASYDPAAQALFDRFTVAPDNERKKLINDLIVAFKIAGVWDKLDCFYMLAAHDNQAARRNWIADNYNASTVNSPTFVVDRGYTGNGTNSRLATGFVPGGGTDKFQLNSGHLAVGVGTNVAEDRNDVGNLNDRIFSRTAGGSISGRSRANVAPSPLPPSTNSTGRTIISRSNSTTVRIHKNGADNADSASTVTGFTASAFSICAAEAAFFSTKQIQLAHWGGYLTPAEVAAMDAAIVTYLTAVGAPTT